jgi:hypothetical protein
MSAPRPNANYIGTPPTDLKREAVSHSATGSSITTGTIDVQQHRGNITAIEILCTSNTLADTDGITFTIGANSSNFIIDEPLLNYSPIMAGGRGWPIPCNIGGGGRINFSFNNDQANAVVVYIILHYNNS